MRRTRLHGLGLHMLVKKEERNLVAQMAYSKPLRGDYVSSHCEEQKSFCKRYWPENETCHEDNSLETIKTADLWYQIENLERHDFFIFGLLRRTKACKGANHKDNKVNIKECEKNLAISNFGNALAKKIAREQ